MEGYEASFYLSTKYTSPPKYLYALFHCGFEKMLTSKTE